MNKPVKKKSSSKTKNRKAHSLATNKLPTEQKASQDIKDKTAPVQGTTYKDDKAIVPPKTTSANGHQVKPPPMLTAEPSPKQDKRSDRNNAMAVKERANGHDISKVTSSNCDQELSLSLTTLHVSTNQKASPNIKCGALVKENTITVANSKVSLETSSVNEGQTQGPLSANVLLSNQQQASLDTKRAVIVTNHKSSGRQSEAALSQHSSACEDFGYHSSAIKNAAAQQHTYSCSDSEPNANEICTDQEPVTTLSNVSSSNIDKEKKRNKPHPDDLKIQHDRTTPKQPVCNQQQYSQNNLAALNEAKSLLRNNTNQIPAAEPNIGGALLREPTLRYESRDNNLFTSRAASTKQCTPSSRQLYGYNLPMWNPTENSSNLPVSANESNENSFGQKFRNIRSLNEVMINTEPHLNDPMANKVVESANLISNKHVYGQNNFGAQKQIEFPRSMPVAGSSWSKNSVGNRLQNTALPTNETVSNQFRYNDLTFPYPIVTSQEQLLYYPQRHYNTDCMSQVEFSCQIPLLSNELSQSITANQVLNEGMFTNQTRHDHVPIPNQTEMSQNLINQHQQYQNNSRFQNQTKISKNTPVLGNTCLQLLQNEGLQDESLLRNQSRYDNLTMSQNHVLNNYQYSKNNFGVQNQTEFSRNISAGNHLDRNENVYLSNQQLRQNNLMPQLTTAQQYVSPSQQQLYQYNTAVPVSTPTVLGNKVGRDTIAQQYRNVDLRNEQTLKDQFYLDNLSKTNQITTLPHPNSQWYSSVRPSTQKTAISAEASYNASSWYNPNSVVINSSCNQTMVSLSNANTQLYTLSNDEWKKISNGYLVDKILENRRIVTPVDEDSINPFWRGSDTLTSIIEQLGELPFNITRSQVVWFALIDICRELNLDVAINRITNPTLYFICINIPSPDYSLVYAVGSGTQLAYALHDAAACAIMKMIAAFRHSEI